MKPWEGKHWLKLKESLDGIFDPDFSKGIEESLKKDWEENHKTEPDGYIAGIPYTITTEKIDD